MIKRIINFDADDWGHIFWLFRNSIKQAFKLEFGESIDALRFIWLHLSYDSERVD